MSDLGQRTTDTLGEWDELPPITLSRWQVRMVLQSLAMCYDDYHQKRPSRALPAIAAIVSDEVIALLQATINDVAIQAGIVQSADISIVHPVRTWTPAPAEGTADGAT